MRPHKSPAPVIAFLLAAFAALWSAAPIGAPPRSKTGSTSAAILPEKRRAEVTNAWQKWRIENLLPSLMRRAGIDMWLVMNREYGEDPVYFTLVPQPIMYSGGQVVLIFHDRGPEAGVELFCSAPHGVPGYKNIWRPRAGTQMQNLADFVRLKNPKRIGVNVSPTWPLADGLTASQRDKLAMALGPELSTRLTSAENLCVGWQETRSPQELSAYKDLCGLGHEIIAEFFSNGVIMPEVTTADEVVWWIRDRVNALGLETWFQPSVDIVRPKARAAKSPPNDGVIRRGDVLHCDFGIKYLGLCTDMQWQAYVLERGEAEVPAGIRKALDNANRMAALFLAEFKEGRKGREIRDAALAGIAAAGLKGSIYTHPLGFYGHAAGCTIDSRDPAGIDEGNIPKWEYPLYPNTVYSIEFSCSTPVPEWGGEELRVGYEEDALFAEGVCRFIGLRQTEFLVIR
jgi:Xaa-Pro aminopeptidase